MKDKREKKDRLLKYHCILFRENAQDTKDKTFILYTAFTRAHIRNNSKFAHQKPKMSSSKNKKEQKRHRDEEEEEDRESRLSELKTKKQKDGKRKNRTYNSDDEEKADSQDEHTERKNNKSKKENNPHDEEEIPVKKAAALAIDANSSKDQTGPKQTPSATISPQDVAIVPQGRFGALSKAYTGNQMVVHRGLGAPMCQHYFDDVLTKENIQKLVFVFIPPKTGSKGKGGCKIGFMDKKDDDTEGVFKELRIRSPPLKVVEARVHGVGAMASNDGEGTTPEDSRRKYALKLEAIGDPDIANLDPMLEKRQKNFVDIMNFDLMDKIKSLLWDNPNIESGLKSSIKESQKKEVESIKDPKARLEALRDKCIKAFTGPASLKNWVFYGNDNFKGKKIEGDVKPGYIFRFKRNVFFERKDQSKTTQPGNAIVTKKAPALLLPTQPTDSNATVQVMNQGGDQGQAYKHYNQPAPVMKSDATQQFADENCTVFGDIVFKNEYEESESEYSDTTPKKAWEIYNLLTKYNKTHSYSRVTFNDANGTPIDLGSGYADINTKVLKPGDYVEIDIKFWVYILSGGMGVRLDFDNPITLVRQGSSTFGMSSKHVYASNSTIAAPIVFGDHTNNRNDAVTPSSVQIPSSPSTWNERIHDFNQQFN